MPPKTKYTHDDIVNAALEVVQRHGIKKLSARTIAKKLNCSTMPIYSCMKSMKDFEALLMKKACEIALEYQTTPYTNDAFVNMAYGYVMFARNEKHLFRFFNDPRYKKHKKEFETIHVENLTAILSESPRTRGLNQGQRLLLTLKGWIFAYGLASLLDNSENDLLAALNDDEEKLFALIKEIDNDLGNSCHAIGDLFMTMKFVRN